MKLDELDEISASPKKVVAPKKVKEVLGSDVDEFEINIEKNYTFELCQKHIAANAYRPPYPRSYQIAGTSRIWDSVANRVREIRYIETAKSIFLEDQIEEGYPRDHATAPIVFADGKLTVRGIELNKMKFILASDQCKKAGRRLSNKEPVYSVLDFDAIKRKSFSTLKLARDAQDVAWNCSEEDMLPTAFALGIDTTMEVDFIRSEFVTKATENPELFNKLANSPKNKISYLIRTCLDKDIISTTKNKGTLIWSDSLTAVTGVPADKDEIIFLTDFCIKEKAGIEFLKQLKSVLAS